MTQSNETAEQRRERLTCLIANYRSIDVARLYPGKLADAIIASDRAAGCDPEALRVEVDRLRAWAEQDRAALSEHYDDVAVDAFAAAMKAKLARKRDQGYGGWDDPEQCHTSYLASLLIDHLRKGDPVDIANFAMMLFHRDGGRELSAVALGALDGEADHG